MRPYAAGLLLLGGRGGLGARGRNTCELYIIIHNAEAGALRHPDAQVLTLLALLVQKYKY
jgi:hypothetical protein